MDYFIGEGTNIIKEFKTLKKMFDYHKNMEMPAKHFCKLYDRANHRHVDGWSIQWDYKNPKWHYDR
ncbi:hypothetical protein [Butyrivibrio proteoclasticus]|uniref:hypothetical protein n=1 Tax=Butyrivibrio proteoclasticus TaxID=43305 RepID=UPI000478A6BC|nr:hypothetical protein [Butyrivibrio proteoclasticus]